MRSYLAELEPAFLQLAEEIQLTPDRDGVVKRNAGKLLPEITRSVMHHVFKALPPLLEDSMASTSISLDKNHYSPSYPYNTEDFKYVTHIERAFLKLRDAGYIQITTKGWLDRPSGKSDNTKYRLTVKFRNWLTGHLTHAGFTRPIYTLVTDPLLVPKDSVLRVQSKKQDESLESEPRTEKLAYPVTPETQKMVKDVSDINKLLAKTWIDLDLTETQWDELSKRLAEHKKKDKPSFIRYTDRRLYRVFNDTNFTTGGRYYGGWWQTIPNDKAKGTAFRRHLVINGKATVEVDFSGLHPSILYAKEGLELPDDPYTSILGPKYRDISKRIFNALINAPKDMKSAPRRLKFRFDDQPLTWNEIKARIYELHAPIRHYFCTGAGMWLMREDSELATGVMHHFAEHGVPCLPVHDSFLVHHGYEDELRAKMNELFTARYGVPSKLKGDHVYFYRGDASASSNHSLEAILKATDIRQEHRLDAFRSLSG
jgi:hypothetical protein